MHEFSLYANQKFGQYLYEQVTDLQFIPLVLNSKFAEEKGEAINEFLNEGTLFNKYSRFAAEKKHFARTNKLLSSANSTSQSQESNSVDEICVFQGGDLPRVRLSFANFCGHHSAQI